MPLDNRLKEKSLMEPHGNEVQRLGRRAFLRNGTLLLAASGFSHLDGSEPVFADEKPAVTDTDSGSLKIGLVTDLHYADKPPRGTRYYRETLGKLDEAAKQFESENLGLLVELGDLIDAAETVDVEKGYLSTVNEVFAAICEKRHYVLGNHCVTTLNKDEFLSGVRQQASYYSFDSGGFHFVVLDACFRGDGVPYGRKNFDWTDTNIPTAELQWLREDLHGSKTPVIVFAHQRLDVDDHYGVKNNADVRRILEESGRVLTVFQGHSHKNDLKEIGGIHYCTLVAMVEGTGAENNGYSVLSLQKDGTMSLTGFRMQRDYRWDASMPSS